MTRSASTSKRRRRGYPLVLVLALGTAGCGARTTTSKKIEHEAPPPPPPSPGSASSAASSCAAVHEPGGYCFASVEAACRALPCSDKGCSIGYSLPPTVACAAPGEAAVPLDAN